MQEAQAQVPQAVSVSSFMTRATNVFASPGDLYGEVATAPVQRSSWLIPYITSLVLVLLMTFVLFNNQSLRQQLLEAQKTALQSQVAEGKMTQEQADRTVEFMESSPFVMVIAILTGALFVTIAMFGIPLVLWLVAKFGLKAAAGYPKLLEVYGLASIIGILGAVVSVLLMHVFDSIYATPGGSMLFIGGGFDSHKFLNNVLASLSLFAIWQAIVAGLGLAKVSGRKIGVGIGIVLGLWLLWVVVTALLGWGAR